MSVNDLITSPWTWLAVFVVLFSLAPIGLLWLAVRCYPRGHERRRELLAEYWAWKMGERPLRVVEATAMCVLHGTRVSREGTILMPRRTSHDNHQEREPVTRDDSPRTLYWWNVPWKPGLGRSMITATIVWFISLFVVFVVLAAILQ